MKIKVYKLEKFIPTLLSQFGDLLAGHLTCTGWAFVGMSCGYEYQH